MTSFTDEPSRCFDVHPSSIEGLLFEASASSQLEVDQMDF